MARTLAASATSVPPSHTSSAAPPANSATSRATSDSPAQDDGCGPNAAKAVLCGVGKGLGAVKDAAGAAVGAIAGAPGAAASAATGNVAGAVADAAETSFTRWLAGGAAWVLTQIAGFITSVTSPDVTATWFLTHYRTMGQVAALLLVPFLIAAVMQASLRRDLGMMAGAVARVPMALVLTAMAVSFTSLAVTATDELTAVVTGSIGHDVPGFLTNVGGLVLTSAGGGPTALVFVALGSLLTLIGGVLVYIELLLREVVVYSALLFMPLALAAIIWPATRRWAVRLAEAITAAVVSKFLIASILSLAVAAASGDKAGSFPAVILGAVMLGMAAYAPYKFLRMLPHMELAAVEAVRGRGGRGVMSTGFHGGREVYRHMERDMDSRVAALHRRTQGLGAGGAGAPAAAAAGAAVVGTGLGAMRASASRSHDAATRPAEGGSTGGSSPSPPPPPASPPPRPEKPRG